jgi:hypothetical protein
MALFLDAATHDTGADASLAAALEMRVALDGFNEQRKQASQAPVRIGIGIHTGPVMLGTVGSPERLDTTVVGNSVNLAARLESLTAFYGCNIIISADTRNALTDLVGTAMRSIGLVLVKGKTEPVEIFDVYAGDDPETLAAKRSSHEDFEAAIADFQLRRFTATREALGKIIDHNPHDRIAQVYHDRAEVYIERPPAEDWDGVIEMGHK